MERRTAEKIIVFLYSVYALALMFATTILGWPGWITPITTVGIVTVWIVYLREIKDYRFRALLYSAVVLATFALYNTQENSFGGILTTYCAAVVVLSILDIPEIVIPEYVCSVLLIAYHGFFGETIPLSTTQERIRSAVQILSVFAVVGITHHLIKKHGATNQHMQQVIEDLKEAEQSKMDFLVNVSHEFRTPVTAICGASEMILQEEVSDSAREEALSIQASGRELLSMIGDVLDFSELESGKMELVEQPYHLTSTINDVINMANAYHGLKNLELIVDFDAKIPHMLLGDEQKLRQVILNLVNNAVKFTESGSITIAVSARPEEYGGNLCVKVKDTGVGIAAEDLEKLFGRFNQIVANGDRQKGGLGIGLAISKKIIQKMNGFISVKSEIGKGSEFQFVVPQKVVDERPIVTVQNAESKHIIFYVNTEKASFSEIRDIYMGSISHMMEGLEIRYHLCRNLGELKRRTEKQNYTHALITQDEYWEDPAYFDSLSKQLKIIMIQDREAAFVPGGSIALLHKPFYVFSLAAVLNDSDTGWSGGDSLRKPEKKFTAPEICALVVDDKLMNLKVVEGLLRSYKIKVITASSGEECLSKLEKVHCDMVFMDYMMPEMDGVETAGRIRNKAGAYFQNIPIIALTANAAEGAREMFLEKGFQEYIAKPVETAQMEKVLRKYIPADKLIWAEDPDVIPAQTPIQPMEKKAHIDYDKGVRYFEGNLESYKAVLQIYLSEGEKTFQEIQKKYQEEDWKNYVILVHSLKSNSFGIGAEELGEMTKALESAGREGDVPYIRMHHAEMMRTFGEVLSEIGGEEPQAQPEKSAKDGSGREPRLAEHSGRHAEGGDGR